VDAACDIEALFTTVGAQTFPIVVIGFRFQQAGFHVSTDVPWKGSAGWGSGTPQPRHSAQFYDFVGRDSTGVRVRAAIFGATILDGGGDYRISPSEQSWVGDALDVLVSDAQMFWTVNQEIPVWKQYANSGINAYWRNKIR